MQKNDNLIADLKLDVITDTSSDFFAKEVAYDQVSESFDDLDPLEQMCFEEGSDGYELWKKKENS